MSIASSNVLFVLLLQNIAFMTLKNFFLFLFAFSSLIFSAQAQQTTINLPSADQTPGGRFFYLHESQALFWQGSNYWATTNFLTYGITDDIEACLTQYQLGFPAQAYSAIGFGYKATKQLFAESLPDLELKLSFGQMFPISTTGLGIGVWTYGFASFRLPVLQTRLAVGISQSPRQNFGINTVVMTASFEQPITDHINILGEWFAGQLHENAYFIPGFNYHTKTLVIIAGYKIANLPGDPKSQNGIVLEIGFFF